MAFRRLFIPILTIACMAMAASDAGAAYPDRTIRLVVPFAPGGGTDVLGRLVGQKLGDRFGVSLVVENRPGANTLIGGEFVAKAAPDGYTLLMCGSSMTLLPLRKQGTPVDMRRDLAPISTVAETPYVILANPAAPYKTLRELVAYAKANPGKVNFGTSGAGGSTHIVGEYLNSVAGIKMVAVAYKGSGPQTVGLLGGEVMVSVDGIGATNPQIRDGKIILLATTGTARSKAFPNVPTVSEVIPGFLARGWYGLMTTAGTPREVIDKLNQAVVAIIALPETQERVAALSVDPVSSTPEEFGKLIADDVEKWGKVARDAGVTIE